SYVDNLPDGVLTANTPASMDVLITQDILIPKGSVLPVPAQVTITVALPGDALGSELDLGLFDNSNHVLTRLSAPWTVPAGAVEIYTNDEGLGNDFRNGRAGSTIPAGKLIYTYGTLPAGYVIPGDAFPDGLPIPPTQKTLAAGAIAPSDVTLPAG